jgi:hypothetical protein
MLRWEEVRRMARPRITVKDRRRRMWRMLGEGEADVVLLASSGSCGSGGRAVSGCDSGGGTAGGGGERRMMAVSCANGSFGREVVHSLVDRGCI